MLFVALVLLLLSAADQLRWRASAERLALIGAGILGMYWFAERLAGLLMNWQLHQTGSLPL